MRPSVTIVIPTHNAMSCLPACHQSFENLDAVDYEVIIVDYRSTDSVGEYVASLRDNRIHLIRLDRPGIFAAMNVGLEKAKSTHVFFMGADDKILPDFNKALANTDGADYCVFSTTDSRGKMRSSAIRNRKNPSFRRGRFQTPHHQSVIFSKEWLRKHAGYDERYLLCGDAELFIRAASSSKQLVRRIPHLKICQAQEGGASSDFLSVWAENLCITARHGAPGRMVFIFDTIVTLTRAAVSRSCRPQV